MANSVNIKTCKEVKITSKKSTRIDWRRIGGRCDVDGNIDGDLDSEAVSETDTYIRQLHF